MAKSGISGLAVALAAGGGVLAYAGFRGIGVAAALREISSKSGPVGLKNSGLDLSGDVVASTPIAGAATGIASSAVGGIVTSAAQPYLGDKYSQARRRDAGYSDCSSFVYKILRDVGLPPTVAWSNTSNYHVDPKFKTVPLAQAQPGDLALSAGHVVILTGSGGANAPAIGQQNTRENVRSGTVAGLMPTPYVIKHYVGGG
jgi:cell wall-associated NlpC family hydrolase